MKDKDVIEGDKLIYEFDLGVPCPDGLVVQYHSSLDLLMPVLEKIRDLGYLIDIVIGVGCDVYITKVAGDSEKDKLNIVAYSSPLKAIYTAVVQFIQWYNQTKQQQQLPHPTK